MTIEVSMAYPSRSSKVTPNGYCLMDVGTHRHVVVGGPFDAFSRGFGVCLGKHSAKAKEAAILVDWPDFGVIDADEFAFLIHRIVDQMVLHPEVPVYIGCRGGIGRTGSVFAAWCGHWASMRRIRCSGCALYNAVETGAQKDLIKSFDVSGVRRLVSKSSTGWVARLRRHFFGLDRNLSAHAGGLVKVACIDETKKGPDHAIL